MKEPDQEVVSVAWLVRRRRKLLVKLLAVPAILFGLLAMHFLADVNEVSPSSMTMAGEAAAADAATSAPPSECGSGCVAPHDMTMAMTCVLALLTSIIILTLLVRTERRNPARLDRFVSVWRGQIASLPPPSPPSLQVLSISRV